MNTYVTRTEAIYREIIEPIENGFASRDEFDIEAIANETIESFIDSSGDYLFRTHITEPEEFWARVCHHAL